MANKKKFYTYSHGVENQTKQRLTRFENPKEMIGGYITAFFLTIFLVGLVSVLMAFPTMWLWNWIMPTVCGFGKLSVWKALGLNFLCGTLFKNNTTLKR